eukprot:1185861-Prorocentrum_minimum.AAC.3
MVTSRLKEDPLELPGLAQDVDVCVLPAKKTETSEQVIRALISPPTTAPAFDYPLLLHFRVLSGAWIN